MVSKATTTTPEAEAYLAAVRAELGHLTEEERGDLLEDLALHLAEVADDDGDEEDGPVGLVARLGEPSEYAAELRAAAGLPAPPGASTSPPAAEAGPGLVSQAARLAESAWRHPSAQKTRSFLGELKPAWWLLRGYLAVAVLAAWTPDDVPDFPIPAVLGSRVIGLVAVAAAMAASVALGRRRFPRAGRALVLALDAVVAISALALLSSVDGRLTTRIQPVFVDKGNPYALATQSGPVTNVFPYSRDGQPLSDVLLFDQDGRPLRAELQQWWADGCQRTVEFPRAADGVPVEFTFPLRYVLRAGPQPGPCDTTVARPPVPLPTFPTEGPPAKP
jgi:hypothetical protein